MNSDKKKIISSDDWNAKVNLQKVSKDQMNKLVMDFLIHEGFKEAAEEFEKESLIQIIADESLEERENIRRAILRGDVDEAIDLINQVSTSILENDRNLLFSLRTQKLINYIRENKITEALAYGQEVLAPASQGNPDLMRHLEKALSLLAFTEISQSPISDICSPMQKLNLASEVNSAILLHKHNIQNPSKIQTISKIVEWTQSQLGKNVSFPKVNVLSKNK